MILDNVLSWNGKALGENAISSSLFAGGENPARLKIPSIRVDARIEPMGIQKDNAMETPKKPADTGWFKFGPRPGERGNSVIAGHRGWKTEPAVFDDLNKVRLGDKIYVEDGEGKELVFVVRDMRVYGADESAPEVWSKSDTAHLNLITCSGRWNNITKTSDERLVIFTDLVT